MNELLKSVCTKVQQRIRLKIAGESQERFRHFLAPQYFLWISSAKPSKKLFNLWKWNMKSANEEELIKNVLLDQLGTYRIQIKNSFEIGTRLHSQIRQVSNACHFPISVRNLVSLITYSRYGFCFWEWTFNVGHYDLSQSGLTCVHFRTFILLQSNAQVF